MEDTGFKDKTGKPILVGDIIQLRLPGSNSKHGGSTLYRVIRFGKHIDLVKPSSLDNKYGGMRFTEQNAQNAVIIDRTS